MHSRDALHAALHRLMAFTHSVKVRRMIEGIALEPRQTFWIMTVNLLADAASVEWSMVFGSRDGDTHWTKIVPRERHAEVRAALLRELNLTPEEWRLYWESIVGYRNQLVAHHDIGATIAKYPQYDKALVAAAFMFGVLSDSAGPEQLVGVPSSLDAWSGTITENMSVIVRKAFEASATLGPNINTAV